METTMMKRRITREERLEAEQLVKCLDHAQEVVWNRLAQVTGDRLETARWSGPTSDSGGAYR